MNTNEVTSRRRQQFIFVAENLVVIYFDPNLHKSDDLISRWHDSFPFPIQTFDELDPCIDYLTDSTTQIILILRNTSYEILVPLIHDLAQLTHIYIACNDTTECQSWMKIWKKIEIISDDTVLMFDQLHCHIRYVNESLMSISVASAPSPTNLDELDPSFMYVQLLKEAILQIEYTEKAKDQFVDFCRENVSKLNVSPTKIDEFARDYTSESAVWWYTKVSFIYFTLNKALRTQDIDVIMAMGFYIQDLERKLEEHRLNMEENTIMILYRGQGMSSAEFERVKSTEGGFFAFNYFVSTSRDKELSYIFADSARRNPDLIGILFVMEIDLSISSVPFASLNGLSGYFEEEILFSINTIFRIGKVESIDDRLWQVNVTLTSDTDPQLTELTEHMRKVHEKSGAFGRIGSLMMAMGKYDKAGIYYMVLLKRFISNNDYESLAEIHNQMGYLSLLTNDLTRATHHLNLSLNIASQHLSSDHPIVPAIYNNRAVLFKRDNKLDSALQSFQHALDITLRASEHNKLGIAAIFKNIGDVWTLKCEYHRALENYNLSHEWFDKGVPRLHPDRAKLYGDIAYVYSKTGNKSTALSYYQKELEMQKKSLPSNHPAIALTHDNIAYILECLNRFQEAAKHAQQAADITRCAFASVHPNAED